MLEDKYCLDLVRKLDTSKFLTTLFAPERARTTMLAIHAFSLEIKQIQAKTSQTTISRMRYAFWKESIDSTFKGNPPSRTCNLTLDPVCQSIAAALEHTRLSQSWFKRIINAYEEGLEINHYADLNQLAQHGENSVSPLIYLNLQALGVSNIRADHAASHIGKAVFIASILRDFPLNLKYRKSFLFRQILVTF
jgi:NADH dehydrogenase [ubiquinone] 1 alpha subcomplex assembly factor 6